MPGVGQTFGVCIHDDGDECVQCGSGGVGWSDQACGSTWAWSVLACLDHLLRWLPSSGHLLLMKPLPWLKLSTSPITISTLRHLYNILLMIIKEGMNNLGG